MPGDIRSLIVGGGIQPLAPWSLNGIPYVSTVQPPTLTTTDFMSVVPTGATRGLIVGLSDPDATASERLRVLGGMITEGTGADSVLIGRSASATQADAIAIGRAAAGSASSSVVIGAGALVNSGSGIAIGAGAGAGAANAGGICIGASSRAEAGASIAIGFSARTSFFNGQTAHIAIGDATVCTYTAASGGRAIAIGPASTNSSLNGVGLGGGQTITHQGAICLGVNATSIAAQCLVIGGSVGSLGSINQVLIGGGDTSSAPPALTIRMTNGSGSDIPGGSMTLISGCGTGAAAASSIIFQTPTVGASGAGAQGAATRLTVGSAAITATVIIAAPAGAVGAPSINFGQANTGIFAAAAGTVGLSANGVEALRASGGGAGEVSLLVYDVTAAALRRVSIGANDSGGAGFRLLRIPN